MRFKRVREHGAVSLFVVIFAALLIITIATAFIRIMLQDQLQASASDLSKSALDSAHAGVEDAKRAIVEYYQRNCQERAAGDDIRCDSLRSALVGDVSVDDGWTDGCQATVDAGVATLSDGEVLVKTDNRDDALNQAYTCAKVQMNPSDYLGSLTPSTSRMLQLKTKDNAAFKRITVQWYSHQGQPVDLDNGTPPYDLPDRWPTNRPAVLRVQLLQYGADFKPSDFDSDYRHNATLFLLPTSLPGLSTAYFSNDIRQSNSSQAAQPVSCSPTPTASRYACQITLELPDPGDPPSTTPRTAYLKVSQYYSTVNTDFRITMQNEAGETVRFSDVQPAVDSTGRANDIFRRIRSRIDLGGSNVPNPEAAIDVTRSLCKEFLVTNEAAYPGNNPCPAPPSP